MTRVLDYSSLIDRSLGRRGPSWQALSRRGWRLIGQVLAKISKPVVLPFLRRPPQHDLSRLPDYLLQDLGIRRDQKCYLAAGLFRRDV
jgi:hypothetical protein